MAKLLQQGSVRAIAHPQPNSSGFCGTIAGWAVLDLNYVEDVAAEVDLNVVMNDQLGIIEVQGTAESGSFSRVQLNQILDVAKAFKSC